MMRITLVGRTSDMTKKSISSSHRRANRSIRKIVSLDRPRGGFHQLLLSVPRHVKSVRTIDHDAVNLADILVSMNDALRIEY